MRPIPAALQEERMAFGWAARLFGRLLGRYVRLVAATSRVSGPPISQGPCIFAIWHESNLAAATAAWKLRDDKRVVSFSTRGFRGIVMNAMLESVGAGVVTLPDVSRGSRGEAARLSAELGRLRRAGWSVVISCDGPEGPSRVAKPGALIVAREAGVPVLPWAVACRPPVRLHGRWDRQLIPLPFGRMRVDEGELIRVGPREPIKPKLARLQSELTRIAELSGRRMT